MRDQPRRVTGEPSLADLAREFGVSGLRVRGYLRQRYPDDAPGKGGTWALTQAQVDEVRAYFGRGRSRPGPVGSPRAVAPAGDYQSAWYWEGNVQQAVERRLEGEGWTIVSRADAASRQPGDDIRAVRDGTTLVVEVKGYPSRAYADPRRASETKRTNPTLQAKHWLAEAVLRSMRTLGAEPRTRVAIALPDFARYRSLVDEIEGPLARIRIEVWFVTEAEVAAAMTGQ